MINRAKLQSDNGAELKSIRDKIVEEIVAISKEGLRNQAAERKKTFDAYFEALLEHHRLTTTMQTSPKELKVAMNYLNTQAEALKNSTDATHISYMDTLIQYLKVLTLAHKQENPNRFASAKAGLQETLKTFAHLQTPYLAEISSAASTVKNDAELSQSATRYDSDEEEQPGSIQNPPAPKLIIRTQSAEEMEAARQKKLYKQLFDIIYHSLFDPAARKFHSQQVQIGGVKLDEATVAHGFKDLVTTYESNNSDTPESLAQLKASATISKQRKMFGLFKPPFRTNKMQEFYNAYADINLHHISEETINKFKLRLANISPALVKNAAVNTDEIRLDSLRKSTPCTNR